MIIEQVWEWHIEDKKCPWILVRPRITTTKKEDPSVLIATIISTWQKNAERMKRRT